MSPRRRARLILATPCGTFLLGYVGGILLHRFGWYAAIPVALSLTVGVDLLVLGRPAVDQYLKGASGRTLATLLVPIAGLAAAWL